MAARSDWTKDVLTARGFMPWARFRQLESMLSAIPAGGSPARGIAGFCNCDAVRSFLVGLPFVNGSFAPR